MINSKKTTLVAFAALFVAAAPHFFFPTPIFLKSIGNMNGFYGIAIWPAAVLAGTAFMLGVDFVKRSSDRWSKNHNANAICAVLGLILFFVGYSYAFAGNYPVVTKSRPSFLMTALFMFMGLRALEALFTHGILQGEVLAAGQNKVLRIAISVVAVAAIYCGFFFQTENTSTSLYFGAIVAETLFGALLFELGLPLYSVVLTRALCGGIFIWFTQMFLF